MTAGHPDDALILAPLGRDADVAAAMLAEVGMRSVAIPDIDTLVDKLRHDGAFAIVTEEAIARADLRELSRALAEQEEWSDFPFILLTQRGGGLERNPSAQRFLAMLGNVTFLERPFHPTTLISVAQSALRARRRQYQARERLEILRSAQEGLRIALAAGGLGAWTLELPDRTLRASPACKANFGRDADDPFGYDDLLASIHADDRDRMIEAVRDAITARQDYDIEYRCCWPDGSVHWVHIAGRPSYDETGRPLHMTGVSQDITVRKAGEQQLQDTAAELERRVEQRTRAHAEAMAQLHEAQKMETIGQLTGGVAHDFNNLLTPIIGGLDMLRRMHDDARSQRVIDGASQASNRAATLVARLLSFSRRQALEARPVDGEALIMGVLDLIRRSLGPQIRVSVSSGADLPAAMVDPNQLELALLNLAVNARDAMQDGGDLAFAVDLFRSDGTDADLRAGDYVRFTVRDTGAGMDAVTVSRAIEPFYSTKDVGKGTGLGLSMVHGLAGQSGGALRISSEIGVGTSVELLLPATHEASIGQPATDGEEPSSDQPSLQILVVDDEELVRRGTADLLREMGHEVEEASSGETALTMLDRGRHQLLVSDYLMPRMNGIQLIRSARLQDPALGTLLVTGFADFGDMDSVGIARLAKPFRRAQLARAIAAVIASKAETTAAAFG